ncbi:hypothetical protein HELRODRAFT_66807, partial [Helobdella robusta]|uniref:USP domain-containing protein n=1 Tax=Helobdella robusta TaxID=6412 RepID=T1FYR1_HELRO
EVECLAATDGRFMDKQLFTCAPKKGYFTKLSRVKLDDRFAHFSSFSTLSSEFSESDESLDELINVAVDYVAGRNLGIQGHHNSCYLDASLFAMFTFNDCFDCMLYRSKNVNDINSYDEIQRTLRDGIVHPLRLNLYVRADKVVRLRQLISDVSRNYGFLNEEKDPEEFLHCLFKETLKLTPLLQFKSAQFFLLVDDPSMTSSQMSPTSTPTLAQLLEASMQKFNLKFTKVSNAPSDVYVSPSMKNISPLSLNLIQSSTDTICNTSKDYTLELFAVVCIKTSHYVSFTKCGYKQDSPWLFFDSMSDRIDSGHGYNIPGIQICEEVTEFLMNESFRNRLESTPDESLSEELKRFLCDGYICFYRSQKPI